MSYLHLLFIGIFGLVRISQGQKPCYEIKANSGGVILGYTFETPPLFWYSFNKRLYYSPGLFGGYYYEIDAGVPDKGFCSSTQVNPSFYKPLYQVRTRFNPPYNWVSYEQSNSPNIPNPSYGTVQGYFPDQQPICYLMTQGYANTYCTSIQGSINPIYYLTFGGTVSKEFAFIAWPIVFILLIIMNLYVLKRQCCGKKGVGYTSVSQKIETFDNESEWEQNQVV